MTQHFTTPSPANPTTEHGNWGTPPQKPKAWWKKPLVIVPVATLLLGVVIGTGNKPEPVTVTQEVPGPERVVTKEVEVPVTPEACITALDLAQQGLTYSAEAMGYMNDALEAAGNLDTAGLQSAGTNISSVTPKLKALTPQATAASTECRSSAK